jgi:acetyltransferase
MKRRRCRRTRPSTAQQNAHREIIQNARDAGRTILTEAESKQVLDAYYIPTVRTVVARTEEEAVGAAERIGYPVVLKLFSETITHKTDVGGVQLNLADAASRARAWPASRIGDRERPARSTSRASPCSP